MARNKSAIVLGLFLLGLALREKFFRTQILVVSSNNTGSLWKADRTKLTTTFSLRKKDQDVSNPDTTTTNTKNTTLQFLQDACDLRDVDWYPSGPDDAWQRRAPYFLLAGQKKSGTTSMATYLNQHPLIAPPRTKELLLFNPVKFTKSMIDITSHKVLVAKARKSMYVQAHPWAKQRKRDYPVVRLQRNASLISFDATPGYFFWSALASDAILCTVPWVKMVLIFREPVDRLWSEYNFYVGLHKFKGSFEQFVYQDLQLLDAAGVLTHDDASEEEELAAWKRYLTQTKLGSVGRGLYVIQLHYWYKALRRVGRTTPKTDIYIVRSEDLKEDPTTTVNGIYDWLGMPRVSSVSAETKMVSHNPNKPTLNSKTKKMLQDLYQPYNERLYDLLGGDWVGVWDYNDSEKSHATQTAN